MAGTPWLGCWGGVGGTGCEGGVRVASQGSSWMLRDLLLSGTGSLSHSGSFRSAVERGSLSSLESVSGISGDFSLKVRHQQMPYQNSRLGAGLW